jgi:hypothetical protein
MPLHSLWWDFNSQINSKIILAKIFSFVENFWWEKVVESGKCIYFYIEKSREP